MLLMKRFIQSSIMYIILSLIALGGENLNLCFILFGGLFIASTIRSLDEDDSMPANIAQIVMSVGIMLLSNSNSVFLLAYEWMPAKYNNKFIKSLVSPVCLIIINLAKGNDSIAMLIIHTMVLFVICSIIFLIENMVNMYLQSKIDTNKAMSISAVNELNQKKINSQLTLKNFLVDRNARLEERENISRNIHNSVGHTITAAILTLDAADMIYDVKPQLAREKMQTANDKIHVCLEAIRHAVRILDDDVEFISSTDFITMLSDVFENFIMDTQIRIRDNFDDINQDFSIAIKHAEFLTGAVGEALSNGVRHGKATLFTIILIVDSNHLQISILDNGHSDFSLENQKDKIQQGFGLKKINSYLSKCAGQMELQNSNGFKISLTLPLFKENTDE